MAPNLGGGLSVQQMPPKCVQQVVSVHAGGAQNHYYFVRVLLFVPGGRRVVTLSHGPSLQSLIFF